MRDPVVDFQRSQEERRILFVFLLLGLIASAVVAFPLMIGYVPAIKSGRGMFFWVPLVASYALGYGVVRVRRLALRR
jgi:hypothetical protein